MCTPAFYGRVSLQNRNPTKKKDGFPGSKYSPGGAPDPEKKMRKSIKGEKSRKGDKSWTSRYYYLQIHIPHPQPPRSLTEEDNHSGHFLIEQNT